MNDEMSHFDSATEMGDHESTSEGKMFGFFLDVDGVLDVGCLYEKQIANRRNRSKVDSY